MSLPLNRIKNLIAIAFGLTIISGITIAVWPKSCNEYLPRFGRTKWCDCLGIIINEFQNLPPDAPSTEYCIGAVLSRGNFKITEDNESEPIEITKDNKLESEEESAPFEPVEGFQGSWGKYISNDYGFLLKYPWGWNYLSSGPNPAQQAIEKDESWSGTIAPSYDTVVFTLNGKEQFKVEVFHEYEKEIKEKNYQSGYLYTYGNCDLRWGFTPSQYQSGTIGNHPFLKVSGKKEDGMNFDCYYTKNDNGNLIVLSIPSALEYPVARAFWLTNQDFGKKVNSDWKTYEDKVNNFSFKYPGEMTPNQDQKEGRGMFEYCDGTKDENSAFYYEEPAYYCGELDYTIGVFVYSKELSPEELINHFDSEYQKITINEKDFYVGLVGGYGLSALSAVTTLNNGKSLDLYFENGFFIGPFTKPYYLERITPILSTISSS